jgi:hypothetical protein
VRTAWSRSRKESISNAPLEHHALLVSFNQNRGMRNVAPIGDLCQWMRTLRVSPPASPIQENQGILGKEGKRYTVNAPQVMELQNAPTLTSMDDYLSNCRNIGLSRRARLDLAIHLTAAIAQFHPTSWIDIAWTWRNFSMMKCDTSSHLCITRHFWSQEVPRKSNALMPSRFWRCLRNKDPMLVRLGFALIELAMGKRLCDIRSERSKEVVVEDEPDVENEAMKDMEDYNTAMDLVEKNVIRDEVSVTYQQVVEACLNCEVLKDEGVQFLKSDSTTFEDDIEKFVVKPLRDYHGNTWGQIAAF